jgi:hypothetical protein
LFCSEQQPLSLNVTAESVRKVMAVNQIIIMFDKLVDTENVAYVGRHFHVTKLYALSLLLPCGICTTDINKSNLL